MDVRRFTALADTLAGRLPTEFVKDLNGGIVVRTERRRNAQDPSGVYILGEYITDPFLGAYVALYHGSFQTLLSGEPDETWEAELWSTIKHELRHHLEARAGVSDLDVEDVEQLAQMQQDHREWQRLQRLQQLARRMRRRQR